MAAPTTSGTYGYSQSAFKLISGALRLCSAIADEETPTSAMAENAMDSLNAMVKGWQASGIHVWAEEECILFLQPGQAQYQMGIGSPDNVCLYRDYVQSSLITTANAGVMSVVMASTAGLSSGAFVGFQLDAGTNFWTTVNLVSSGNVITLNAPLPSQATSGAITFGYVTPLMRPLRVPEGRRFLYSSKIQTPLIVMSRLDYDYLPNPYNTGVITQYFYDPHMGDGAYTNAVGFMNVWPTPVDYTNAMRFVAQRPLQDFATLANIPDFPAEWLAALRWNLATEIAPEYDVPADRFDRLKGQADMWFLRASSWDREPESVLFGVAFEPAYRT
jgi:hypothetical protein